MIRPIGKSWKLLSRRERLTLGLLFLSRILTNALDVAAIATVGLIAASAFNSEMNIERFNPLHLGREEAIFLMMVGVGGLFVLKTGFSILLARVTLLFLSRIETAFSMRVAELIFSGNLKELKSRSNGEIDWAILHSPRIAFTVLFSQFGSLIAEGSLALMILAILVITDWKSSLIMMVYFSVMGIVFQLASRRLLSTAGSKQVEGSVSVYEQIAAISRAFREIRVAGKESVFLAKLRLARQQVASSQATHDYVVSLPRQIMESGLIVGVVAYLGLQFLLGGGGLDASQVGIFLAGSLRLMSALLPLQRAAMSINYESRSAASAQDFLLQVKNPPSTTSFSSEHDLPATLSSQRGFSLELSGVSFTHESNQASSHSISDISLTIDGGSFVAVIGPSGAGKTTLVDLICGLYEPTKGIIRIEGKSPQEQVALRPGSISYAPQKPGLLPGTLAQNIAMGESPEEVNQDLIWSVIDQANLREFVEGLPKGLETDIGRQLDGLSGGQIQRLGLARALYSQPSLLILDEATSALDGPTEEQISQNLRNLLPRTTLLVIAHRLSTIKRADAVYLLDNGTLVGGGSLSELMEDHELVKRYVKAAQLEID